jgi:hypothetical protein
MFMGMWDPMNIEYYRIGGCHVHIEYYRIGICHVGPATPARKIAYSLRV